MTQFVLEVALPSILMCHSLAFMAGIIYYLKLHFSIAFGLELFCLPHPQPFVTPNLLSGSRKSWKKWPLKLSKPPWHWPPEALEIGMGGFLHGWTFNFSNQTILPIQVLNGRMGTCFEHIRIQRARISF